MERSSESDAERREIRALVERIKRGACVLVLGPRVAVRPDDPARKPLDQILADELLAQTTGQAPGSANLRVAADAYFRMRPDRDDLELTVRDFYEREAGSTTNFHRDLAQLPFKLCVSASPDSLMLTALKEEGKTPQKGYYSFKPIPTPRLFDPTPAKPLVYYLFGHFEEPRSLVLTEGDLIEFLVSIIRGTPQLPDQVRSVLGDPDVSYLFVGFGFQNWYLRVLLQVMNVYGHRSNAFEDDQFFNLPDHRLTVGFFSGNRLIDFRPLRWEVFAKQLREAYNASAPQKSAETAASRGAPPANAPKAFISYASEDREAVDALVEELDTRGIRVWQDKQDLRAGDGWRQQLLHVIKKQVDYVIVVQTPEMLRQVTGVFHWEIKAALDQQSEYGEFEGQPLRFVLPVTIGACGLLSSFEKYHVIDVSNAAGVDALTKSIFEDWERRAIKSGAQARS